MSKWRALEASSSQIVEWLTPVSAVRVVRGSNRRSTAPGGEGRGGGGGGGYSMGKGGIYT